MVTFHLVLFILSCGGLLAGSCQPDTPTTAPPSRAPAVNSLVAPVLDSVAPKAPTNAGVRPAKELLQVVELPHGITLHLGRPETYDDLGNPLTLYSHLQVLHAGRLVYEDSTHEYEVGPRPYPTSFADGTGGAVLLLEVSNRDLNELLRLRIQNWHATVSDTLPAFTNGPAQLDDDAPLELAGMLTSNERWEEAGREYTTYNPIRYYELTAAGPVLDAQLTERKIRAIYGQFLGFCYRERPGMPAKVGKAYGAELTRIASKAKQR